MDYPIKSDNDKYSTNTQNNEWIPARVNASLGRDDERGNGSRLVTPWRNCVICWSVLIPLFWRGMTDVFVIIRLDRIIHHCKYWPSNPGPLGYSNSFFRVWDFDHWIL